jgi:ribose transport system permease protein
MSVAQPTHRPTSGPAGAPPARRVRDRFDPGAAALAVVMAAVLAVGALTTEGFVGTDNLRAVFIQVSIIGILAVAMTPLTMAGKVVSLATQQQTLVAAALFLALSARGYSPLVVLLIIVAVELVIGAIQGAVVAAGLDPIITTLATGAILFGALDRATAGGPVTAPGDAISYANAVILGVPLVVIAFAVVTIVAWLVTHRMIIGRKVVLVGSNPASAALAGISVGRVTVAVFLLLSVGCALAGVLLGAQVGQVTANAYGSLSFSVIAAVLVGGTPAKGGSGSPLRSAAGAVLIGLLGNVMVLHDLSNGWRLLAQGLLVTVAVVLVHVFASKESR